MERIAFTSEFYNSETKFLRFVNKLTQIGDKIQVITQDDNIVYKKVKNGSNLYLNFDVEAVYDYKNNEFSSDISKDISYLFEECTWQYEIIEKYSSRKKALGALRDGLGYLVNNDEHIIFKKLNIYDIKLKFTELTITNYDENKKIGTMRFDFFDGNLANKWIVGTAASNISIEKLKEIQKVLNYIQFEEFNSLRKIVRFCGGTSYNDERYVEVKYNSILYIIKLIPVYGSYNGYIHVFY